MLSFNKILLLISLCFCFIIVSGQPPIKEQTLLDSTIARTLRAGFTNRDSAVGALWQLYLQCNKLNYTYGKATSLLGCGVLHANGEGPAAPALQYFRKAAPFLAEAAKKDEGIYPRWYTCMGAAMAKTGQMDSAMYYYTLSLNAHLKRKEIDYTKLLQNYLNLQVIYFEQEQFDKVLLYAWKTIAIASERDMKAELFNAYMVVAGTYIELKNIDSAKAYINLTEKLRIAQDDVQKKTIHEIKGFILLHEGKAGEAIHHFNASLYLNRFGSVASLKGMADAYVMLHNDALAESYYLQAQEEEYKLRGYTSLFIEISNNLADFYGRTGNFKGAFNARTIAAKAEKEYISKQKTAIITRLETRFRWAEQEKQIASKQVSLLSAENNIRKKNLWIGIITAIAFTLAAVLLLLYQKHKAQQHRTASLLQQQEIGKLRAVIDAEEKERSRIGQELHDDIMGQLSVIRMNMETLPERHPDLGISENYQELKGLLDNAGRAIRQTAHNLAPDTILAEGLPQAILYFCNNIQKRTGILINFQHYGTGIPLRQEVGISLYRITQELLQNVIKHARARNVLVQLNQHDTMCTLTIEDDGIGFDPQLHTGKGMGLNSIRTRLKALNGFMDIYPRQPNGTSITIEINNLLTAYEKN